MNKRRMVTNGLNDRPVSNISHFKGNVNKEKGRSIPAETPRVITNSRYIGEKVIGCCAIQVSNLTYPPVVYIHFPYTTNLICYLHRYSIAFLISRTILDYFKWLNPVSCIFTRIRWFWKGWVLVWSFMCELSTRFEVPIAYFESRLIIDRSIYCRRISKIQPDKEMRFDKANSRKRLSMFLNITNFIL